MSSTWEIATSHHVEAAKEDDTMHVRLREIMWMCEPVNQLQFPDAFGNCAKKFLNFVSLLFYLHSAG
jgi:hypothetical protein